MGVGVGFDWVSVFEAVVEELFVLSLAAEFDLVEVFVDLVEVELFFVDVVALVAEVEGAGCAGEFEVSELVVLVVGSAIGVFPLAAIALFKFGGLYPSTATRPVTVPVTRKAVLRIMISPY